MYENIEKIVILLGVMREHVVHLNLDVGVEGASGLQSSSSLG